MNTAFSADCLAGRSILITGASSGLGRAVAQACSEAGAKVIAAGRNEERLAETCSLLRGDGHSIEVAGLDDPDSVADWLKALVSRHGALHGIFHGAGTELVRPARMTKKAQIDEVFGSSTMAALGISRAAAQKGHMHDGGSVVFMSSVAAQRGTAGMVAYSAAKAAIDGLVRSLSCELAPRQIRVNAIAAGAVVTRMHERLVATLGAEGVADYERRHLLGFGRPEDIAHAALFLLSDAGRWVTGAAIPVDGGYLVR